MHKTKKYNKLVRDRIPEIIKLRGGCPVIRKADEKEYWQKLKEKLREEVEEFIKDETKEELADILEVINAIGCVMKLKDDELEIARIKKAEERGGFEDRIILDEA